MIRDQELHEARCTLIVERIAYELDLQWLRITNRFDMCTDEPDRTVCETIADWEYRQVTFAWNIVQVAAAEDAELEQVATHELCHALIAPLWESLTPPQQGKLTKLNELATENVARVITHLLDNRA